MSTGSGPRVAVCGSIASDNLMTFAGRFTDSLVEGALEHVSLSFLVDDLDVRRGGVAANIAFGMAVLGVRPVLVGAVGADFADYRSWLDRHGVDTSFVHVSDTRLTARFLCTTDRDLNQIASFYAGAMTEARDIELAPIVERLGGLDLVLVSPDDPDAMTRHTEEAVALGVPFVADPSQQLARMEGPELRHLIEGAAILLANEYERALVIEKTGWTFEDDVLGRVGLAVTTLGADGCVIEDRDGLRIEVAAAAVDAIADPTGVGDAFRAGFLTGHTQGLAPERSAQLGSTLAALCLEVVGPQEYTVERSAFLARFSASYGEAASTEVAAVLG